MTAVSVEKEQEEVQNLSVWILGVENRKGCDIGYALAACSREGANNVDARTVTAF